jgi:predicted amidohydrolase
MNAGDEEMTKVSLKSMRGLDRAFFLVMDFMECKTLCDYTATVDINEARDLLFNIGRMLAFDAFINNNDRIPAVHNNDGNVNNVLISPGGQLLMIDTCIVSIDPNNKYSKGLFAKYITKVKEWLKVMYTGSDEEVIAALARVREFTLNETGKVLTDASLLLIRDGARHEAFRLSKVKLADLVDMRSSIQKEVTVDWEAVWEKSMQKINVDYLEAILKVFVEGSALNTTEADKGIEFHFEKTELSEVGLEVVVGEPSGGIEDHLKIMMLQHNPMDAGRWADLIGTKVQEEFIISGRKVDFVVFPEGAVSYFGPLKIPLRETNKDWGKLCSVAKEHGVHIVCGTCMERVDPDPSSPLLPHGSYEAYITSVLINDEGEMIGAYRKRDTMSACNDGKDVGVFDTKFGPVGILICYDAENPTFVDETLAKKPLVIFNPAHLPKPQGLGEFPDLILSGWRVAIDSSSRLHEYTAYRSNVPIVRVDLPAGRGGPGNSNSFLATPSRTVIVPSINEECFCVTVKRGIEVQMVGNKSAGRERSERQDNTGLRHVTRTFRMQTTEGNSIVAVYPIKVRGKPKGQILVQKSQGLELWDVAEGKQVMKYTNTDGSTITKVAVAADSSLFVATHSNDTKTTWKLEGKVYKVAEDLSTLAIPESCVEVMGKSKVDVLDSSSRKWNIIVDENVKIKLAESDATHFAIAPPLCIPIKTAMYDDDSGLLYLNTASEVHAVQFHYNREQRKLSLVLPLL